jgi:hypothetical protein
VIENVKKYLGFEGCGALVEVLELGIGFEVRN